MTDARPHPRHANTRAQLLLLLLTFLLTGAPPAGAAVPMAEVAAAALRTQAQCQMKLHHDADDYVVCVDDLLKANKAGRAVQLGIEYFGWVGALNSARMSLPGSMDAAQSYLRMFRKTQRRLSVSDAALCATVPGDCRERIARMRLMEGSPR